MASAEKDSAVTLFHAESSPDVATGEVVVPTELEIRWAPNVPFPLLIAGDHGVAEL
jgi:hypothetical protein